MKKQIALMGMLTLLGGIIISGAACQQSASNKSLKVDLQMEQAIREVEVSIWETANAVFYYQTHPSSTSLNEFKKQLKDVEQFMGKYKALINTSEEQALVAEFETLWASAVAKGSELMALRDKITAVHEKAWDAVHEADDVIDYKVQVAFVEGLPKLLEKEKAIREVEVSIWEAISATNYYAHRPYDKPKREYPHQIKDVKQYWNKYRQYELVSDETHYIKEFEGLWSRSVDLMGQVQSLTDELVKKQQEFWEASHAVDDVIDFKIQEYLKKRLVK